MIENSCSVQSEKALSGRRTSSEVNLFVHGNNRSLLYRYLTSQGVCSSNRLGRLKSAPHMFPVARLFQMQLPEHFHSLLCPNVSRMRRRNTASPSSFRLTLITKSPCLSIKSCFTSQHPVPYLGFITIDILKHGRRRCLRP